MRSPRKAEILLALAGFVFACFCAEVAARIWLGHFARFDQYLDFSLYTEIDPNNLRFQPHHYLDYALMPNYHRGRTSHNSLGYRGEEFPKAKPKGEFRIVAIGGSTTYDEYIEDDKDTHTKQLQDILRDRYGYQNIRVINAGVPAYNSWESLINLEFRVLDLSPDLIIFFDNSNDAHARLVHPSLYAADDSARRTQWSYPPVPWWERSAFLRILSRYFQFTYQVGLEDFVDRRSPYMVMGYTEAIGGDPMKVIEQNLPIYFERNVRNMVAIAREHGITPLLVTWPHSPYFNDYAATPHYEKAFREHNDVIKRIAKSHGVPLFDLEAVMPKDKEYYRDGRHNNAKGARKHAELYAEFLTSHHLLPKE